MRYPVAKDAAWWALQGEGHLRGFQMAFLRLAGCSVGCGDCDTDYSVGARMSVRELIGLVSSVCPASRDRWVWITGGEPTDHNLAPLLHGLSSAGFSTCVATSGVNRLIHPVDWLSVSPHSIDGLKQRYGQEIKLVDGLNGLDLDKWIDANPDDTTDFMYRYVQPLWVNGAECVDSMVRCLDFLERHPNWSLSRQDHKHWGVS